MRSVIADSQYSDGKIRNAVSSTVIPYPSNQKRGVKGLLRVDKKFRTYGPEAQKREYHRRPHIEAVYSLPEDAVQPSNQQGQRHKKRHVLRSLQSVMRSIEQRSSRKHQETRESSLPNILQHVISPNRKRAGF